MNIIKNKIKLIVWDLDETFWSGTLSEEGVEYSNINHDIIIELTNRGIVNSICSKNDFNQVKDYLTEKGIWEYFVFPEISWNPKGKAVQSIIEDMALRPDNVLFIDDNVSNLNEVEFVNNDISVCEPSIIPILLESELVKGKKDKYHSRLNQYKVLEKKREVKVSRNLSNFEFLQESEIKVEIKNIDENNIDRAVELVERTNQLNYTKLRQSKSELIDLISSSNYSGVIEVKDKYGDYGISGLFVENDDRLVHFLFSCRTMNMGVENWLYNYLGRKNIFISGEVATQLSEDVCISHINSVENISKENTGIIAKEKCLIVGGCDLEQVVHYLGGNVKKEFNFVNSHGVSVHTEHSSLLLDENMTDHTNAIERYKFFTGYTGQSKVNTEAWDVLIYSPLNDYSRGLYKHKNTGVILPFDSFNINWTMESNHENIPPHLATIPLDEFKLFSEQFDYLGALPPEDFFINIESLVVKYSDRKIFILTGSEVELKNTKWWEKGMAERHKIMNRQLEALADKYDNFKLVDVRKFCNKSSDHGDNIRHYVKSVYFDMAREISEEVNELVVRGRFMSIISALRYKVKKKVDVLLNNSFRH